ncbi:class I SAM-dependent methyltransferase [Streptomyces sp. NPDC059382]|uniref:class I SAM-dependent methyltransferase n=1 Tax=Streptomyces sp. NPDC059382 TaxID=3346816 RepID=UPI0036B4AF04
MTHPSHRTHPHDHGDHGGHGATPAPASTHDHDHDHAEILDLDADVLAEHLASVTAWLPVTAAPRHIVDLGCGTGAGTLALLTRFPEAQVTAVDSSATHLRRLREKADAGGVADRVRTVLADLDTQWPDLSAPDLSAPDLSGPDPSHPDPNRPHPNRPDLVWASASLHHMVDPRRTLRQVHDSLAPGGLFAVVELAGFPRFLPADAPEDRPGLEDRCHLASERRHDSRLPHRGADWGPMLTAAGFEVEAERTIAVDIEASPSNAVGRYALSSLRRVRAAVDDHLSPEDLAALDRLLDTDGPHGILHRPDLAVRTRRTVWAARRT